MTDDATTAFKDRLHRVAVDFILPTGLDVNTGVGGAATVAVATLGP